MRFSDGEKLERLQIWSVAGQLMLELEASEGYADWRIEHDRLGLVENSKTDPTHLLLHIAMKLYTLDGEAEDETGSSRVATESLDF